jgi:hypothetical protein
MSLWNRKAAPSAVRALRAAAACWSGTVQSILFVDWAKARLKRRVSPDRFAMFPCPQWTGDCAEFEVSVKGNDIQLPSSVCSHRARCNSKTR